MPRSVTDLQLVIFDCDGVLVDSEAISNRVLAEMLDAEGMSMTPAEARAAYPGLRRADLLAAVQADLGRTLPPGWLERFESERTTAFRSDLKAVPGAAQAVRAVSSAGAAVCVASQARLEQTRLSLELTGLRELFGEDALFSGELVPLGKPHPDLFLHAAITMGAEPTRCAVVEDSPSGVRAAVAARMRVLGYVAGGEEATRDLAGAEVVHALSEVPARLGLT